MKLKRDTKFGEESICCFKIGPRNLINFNLSTQVSKIFTLVGSKFEEKLTGCLENDMRNLANFHQSTRKCQNWKLDKILLSKVENSKYFFKNWLLVTKVHIIWAKKSREELSFMTLKSYANFEERLTSGLKKDMRNLANFHQSTWKCQNWDFDGILLYKVEKV